MLFDPIEIQLSPNFFFARAEQFEGRFVGAKLFSNAEKTFVDTI